MAIGKNTPALKQVTVLEATLTDLPKPVKDEIRNLWADMEFGNDNYYYSWFPDDDPQIYPIIGAYLKEHKVEGPVLIHWWW